MFAAAIVHGQAIPAIDSTFATAIVAETISRVKRATAVVSFNFQNYA